jgi:hypothetical protein
MGEFAEQALPPAGVEAKGRAMRLLYKLPFSVFHPWKSVFIRGSKKSGC